MFATLRAVFISVLFALLCLTGAHAAPSSTEGQSVSPYYKIGPGDVLIISVWKEEGMDQEVLVKPDSGLTTEELTAELKHKLKRYIPNPVVTVSVLQAVSNKIYVVGKVNRPGEYKATHYMDVLQALSLAGGLTPYADSDDIKIIRRHNGKKVVFEFDYDKVISGKKLEMNILLEAGDTVAVP